MSRSIFLFIISILISSCAHQKTVEITATTPLYKNSEGTVPLGGLSDLYFAATESTNEQWVFYTMTDRGPNAQETGDKKNPHRPFLFPSFSPLILKIVYKPSNQKANVVKVISLTRPDGPPASGLPSARSQGPLSDEVGVDLRGKVLTVDPWGLDPEGLVQDDKGNFWISEEYAPALFQVSGEGRVLERFSPRGAKPTLPAFLAKRKLNRGFEALTWNADKNLLLFLQSGIPSQKRSELASVVEFDPRAQKVMGLYFYPLSPEGGKIGGATISDRNEIMVLEQNGKTGDKAWQRVFKLDFAKSKNLATEALQSGIDWQIPTDTTALGKTEVLNLTAQGLQSFEKLEGLSFSPRQDFVILNDNDFGVNEENKGGSNLFFIPQETK